MRRYAAIFIVMIFIYSVLNRPAPYQTEQAHKLNWGERQYRFSGKGLDKISILTAAKKDVSFDAITDRPAH